MNDRDIALLRKLGIHVNNVEYTPEHTSYRGLDEAHKKNIPVPFTVSGSFTVDESTFRPMCRLIELVDLICESKNPTVEKQFHHLITLLNLTKNG